MGDSTAARLASAPLMVQVQRRARYARAMAGLWPTWLPAHERIRAGTQSKFLRSGRLCGMGRCALADGIRMGGCCLSSEYRSALRRSEEHTSELQSLMRISYAVFCL